MHDQCIFADYFLLGSGENDRQIKAIADNILAEAREKADERARHVEGTEHDGWLLIDFGHVVVHVFSPERRDYYNLEELWHNARVILRMQ